MRTAVAFLASLAAASAFAPLPSYTRSTSKTTGPMCSTADGSRILQPFAERRALKVPSRSQDCPLPHVLCIHNSTRFCLVHVMRYNASSCCSGHPLHAQSRLAWRVACNCTFLQCSECLFEACTTSCGGTSIQDLKMKDLAQISRLS